MKTAKALPILMYHHVSPSPGLVTVSPENFAAQMAWLAQNGWHTVTTHELEHFLAGKPLPSKSVMITFDDGYLDNYVHAYPILKRFGLHAVIFLVTGWIGEGPPRHHAGSGGPLPETPDHRACKAAIAAGESDRVMLRWSEIERMAAEGTAEFHSHTHTHQRWDQAISDIGKRIEALRDDLAASRSCLAQRLGRPSRHLCWPWGICAEGYGQAASAAGFAWEYGTTRGTVRPGDNDLPLPRLAARDDAAWIGRQCRLQASPLLSALYRRLRS